MYTIMDTNTGERWGTTDYESYGQALREKNRLELRYGSDCCLIVVSIDTNGDLQEVEDK